MTVPGSGGTCDMAYGTHKTRNIALTGSHYTPVHEDLQQELTNTFNHTDDD